MAAPDSTGRVCVQTGFHVAALSFYIYVMALDRANERALAAEGKTVPGRSSYAGRYKYLTQINLVLQGLFFAISIAADFLRVLPHWKWLHEQLKKSADFIYATVAFPLTTLVVCAFWPIYLYNRELIFPRVLDDLLPPMMNYYVHLHVIVIILLEGAICYHSYPSTKRALTTVCATCVLYALWLHWVYYFGGIWAYRFLHKMGGLGRSAFIASMALATVFYFYLGKWWNKVFWSGRIQEEEKKMKKTE